MTFARIVAVTFVSWGLAIFLGYHIYSGVKTGMLRHTDTDSVYNRGQHPLLFWLLIAVFAGLASAILFAWVRVVIESMV